MTWNPRKKNYLTLRPTPAPPLITPNEDRDLDIAVQRLINVEGTIRKLTKEAKRYLEAIINLDRADQRLSSNLSTSGLAHLSDDFRRIVENYHSVTTQAGKTVHEFSLLTGKTFVEPLKKLRDEFALVEDALAKREELVGTWKCSYNRIKKLQEKKDRTASHIAKVERERRSEEVAAKELKLIHSRLLIELPWFLEKRLEYIKPSVHALILNQLDYYGNTTKLFTQLMPPVYNPSHSPSSPVMSDEEYHGKINEEMTRIRGLTIVKP
ncbi:uncharacterized protein LOC107037480 [Diachasma alloeum]|uniref:uncharacterized protein LOC107037480 n=1 Tax=Diachasma alloeum TaxID=454923 RepID=UPI0007382D77|nr:uncharacterized protein LOC107037480 [Diachasma alloeum]